MSEAGEIKETKGKGYLWDKDNPPESKQLRRPREAALKVTDNEGSSINPSQMQPVSSFPHNSNDLNHKVINSKLNAGAQEFVPKYIQSQTVENQVNQPDPEYEEVPIFLKEMLKDLTLDPGKYDELSDPLADVVLQYIDRPDIRKKLINVIIEECIAESNLRYNGVRFCNDLIKKGGASVKKCLLERCKEIHKECSVLIDRKRTEGFAMLLAELYLQIEVEENSVSTLGNQLIELLNVLLTSETDSNIKPVCQILKLTGVKLEDLYKDGLDELFKHLKGMTSNSPDMDPNLRFIINNVIDMRSSNWGRSISYQSPQVEIQNSAEFTNDPVFFGPDGKVISEEETSFLHENVPISEDADDYLCDQELMDDEAIEDFHKFLNMKSEK